MITKKEIESVLNWAQSDTFYIPDLPLGVSRFQAFLAIKPLIKARKYWETLSAAYTGCQDLFYYKEDVIRAFKSDEPEREFLMNKAERKLFDELPEKIVIYRGMAEAEKTCGNFGVSWTLDESIANFFAIEFKQNYSTNRFKKIVCKKEINKADAIAFLNGRQEQEIIYIKESGMRTSKPIISDATKCS